MLKQRRNKSFLLLFFKKEGLAVLFCLWCTVSSAQPAAVLVTTAQPQLGTLPETIQAYGTAAPALESGNAITLQQDGRIAAILVTPGDRVRPGDRLLSFDLAPNAASAYAQAVSAAALAESERAHTARLLALRLATRDQAAQADKALSDARAALDALRAQGADRGRTDIRAPYAGVVNAIPVSQGERVVAGAPLMSLTRLDGTGLDGLVVTVGVEPSLQGRVHAGQAATLHRLPDWGTNPAVAGRVLRVDGMVNPRTRLVDVDIGVAQGGVLSGEGFAAAITAGQAQGWIVPYRALLGDEQGDHLFQVQAGHARRVFVSVLAQQGDQAAVDGHLDPAQPVVLDGAAQVNDGDPVRTAP